MRTRYIVTAAFVASFVGMLVAWWRGDQSAAREFLMLALLWLIADQVSP